MSEERLIKSGEKKVKTLCRLSPSRCASIRCLKLKNGRSFTVITSGNERIFVMEDKKIEHIVNVHSPVINVLDHVDILGNMWVITEDGKLWAIPLSKKNTIEQKHPPFQIDDDISETDGEIFAELLGSTTDVSQKQPTISPSPIMHCSEDCIIHWEPGLRNVAVGADHVIMCSTNDNAIRVSVYPWTNDSPRDRSHDLLRISPNPLYRTALTTCTSKNSTIEKGATVLLYLKPSNITSSGCASGVIVQQLFHAMFRTQLRSNIHMLLLGTDCGMVSFIPVGAGIRDTHVPPEVLYHLEQPVVGMFPVCLSNSDAEAASTKSVPNCLILIGSLGKLVLITQQSPGGGSIEFREYHIPAPVVSSTLNPVGDTLFYSTLKEIYAVPLRYAAQTSDNRERSKNPSSSHCLPSSLSPILLPLPKVSALSVTQSSTEMMTDSLLAIKTDGRVLLVEQPLVQLAKPQFGSHVPQVTSGEKIKQYLHDIQEKSNCVNHLGRDIQELNDVIKQLNIATHMVCEILRTQEQTCDSHAHLFEVHQENTGIVFSVHVDYEVQGANSSPQVNLHCDLMNSTKFPLSRGWSLVVNVHTRHPWFNENGEAAQVVSHSVVLDSSSTTHHLSIPLEHGMLSYFFPVKVSCFICFDVKEILPEILKDFDPALKEEGFAALVKSVELNILHFLRTLDSTTIISTSESHRPCANHIQVLQQTLKNLNSSMHTSPPSQSPKKPDFSTISVSLSKEAVEYIHKTVAKNILAENLQKPHSKELSVLYFLLFDSRRHLSFDKAAIHGNSVQARTPNEEEVKFQVVSSSTGTFAFTDGLEVRMHTSSEALRCAIHAAVLHALEPVLQRETEKTTGIPISQLQKHLTKLEEVQTLLGLLHESSLPVQANAELIARYNLSTFKKLINIYKELRKVPTLVP